MAKDRIVLLNPPGDKPYLRDYFCSTIPKGRYYWPSIDLMVQAGILEKSYHIKVIDAISENIDTVRCAKLIKEFSPHAILFVTGSQSFSSDSLFVKTIKMQNTDIKIIGTGEVFLDSEERFIQHNKWIDGALLSFIEKDIRYFMDKKFDAIENMYFRAEGEIHKRQNFHAGEEFEIPIPPHKLFPLNKYHIPYSKYHPFASILTTYGCPYRCYFCNSGSSGFRQRKKENVIEELQYIRSIGIKEIFYKDMTFGGSKKHTLDLLNMIHESELKFSWSCYSRIDIMDEEMVKWMKKTGCHLIRFGIESLNLDLMKKYGKGYTIEDMLNCFRLLKAYRIDFGLHFILGLPGETKEGIMDIINFAGQTDCRYASFNIAAPRFGAEMRKDIINNPLSEFTYKELIEFASLATRKFYGNQSFIFNQFIKVRSFYELKNLFYNGIKIWLSY